MVEGERFTISPGECVLISSGSLHSIEPEINKTGQDVMSIGFNGAYLGKMYPAMRSSHICYLEGTPDSRKKLNELCEEVHQIVEKDTIDYLELNYLFFGMVKNKIGMKVGPVSLVLNIIGFVIVGFTSTTALWYVGVTILKVGFCWWMPYINFLVTEDTDESNSAMAASLGFAGNSIGSFAFGYVLAGMGALTGGISSHQAFIYGAILIALTFVVLVGFNFTNKKKAVNC